MLGQKRDHGTSPGSRPPYDEVFNRRVFALARGTRNLLTGAANSWAGESCVAPARKAQTHGRAGLSGLADAISGNKR